MVGAAPSGHDSCCVIYTCLRLVTRWNSLFLRFWTQLLFFSFYPRCLSTKPLGFFCECRTTRYPLGPGHALFYTFIGKLSFAIEEIGTSIIFKSYLGVYSSWCSGMSYRFPCRCMDSPLSCIFFSIICNLSSDILFIYTLISSCFSRWRISKLKSNTLSIYFLLNKPRSSGVHHD